LWVKYTDHEISVTNILEALWTINDLCMDVVYDPYKVLRCLHKLIAIFYHIIIYFNSVIVVGFSLNDPNYQTPSKWFVTVENRESLRV
jgi:lysylphosphatidylglycerol synthetase-like protein (DUF2156 family)